jgi:hypothetical protein
MVPVPAVTAQVTPALAPSAVTVAVNVWLAPPIRVVVVGLTETPMGVRVTVAVPVLVVSVLLVAVTVAEVAVITAGAVYTPAEVMVPVEAVHVTPAFAESFVTVAVNVWLAPPISVAVAGLTETAIAGGAEVPPQPAMTKRERKKSPARRRGKMRREIMGVPHLYLC